jgi:hypothetical protein
MATTSLIWPVTGPSKPVREREAIYKRGRLYLRMKRELITPYERHPVSTRVLVKHSRLISIDTRTGKLFIKSFSNSLQAFSTTSFNSWRQLGPGITLFPSLCPNQTPPGQPSTLQPLYGPAASVLSTCGPLTGRSRVSRVIPGYTLFGYGLLYHNIYTGARRTSVNAP